ncbi:hypothetical protein [Brevibacillus dissolubilis]|uniref:hypothetical protein n=1 Tax=Brevibacillus dissolubilis TaxID=1844116 RepID=UPI001115D9B5|nr:hypothetical protein [Brevibacillus dissolubilis]
MWKKLTTGALALAFVLSIGTTPTFAQESVKSTNVATPDATVVKYVGNWEVLFGEGFTFTQGASLVGNVSFIDRKLTFQFQKPGYVTVKMIEEDGSSSYYYYSVK